MYGFFSIFTVIPFLFSSIFILIVFVAIIKGVMDISKRQKNIQYFAQNVINNAFDTAFVNRYQDISKAKQEEFHIDDLNSFKNKLYNIFEDFETAYNSLDFNTMKQISTSQVFENYYTGISLNIQDGKKKVIDDIKRNEVIVFAIDSTTIKQIVQTLITITYTTYTTDKNGYIISGSKDNKITETFEVNFKKEYKQENFQKCPNCGATVSGKKCDYCRTTIKDCEFKISSIKKVIK